MIAASAMMVTLFLGGWTLPFAGLDQPRPPFRIGSLHIGIFLAKMLFVEFMIIWVRWMWPRFRYDQLMDLGWRRFIPLALANILVCNGCGYASGLIAQMLDHDCINAEKLELFGNGFTAGDHRRVQGHHSPLLSERK